MRGFSPLIRISLGLVVVTSSIIVGLDFFGFVPDPTRDLVESRIQLCETLAIHAASSADHNDLASIRSSLQVAVRRNKDVLSAGMRSADGRLLVTAGNHQALWQDGSPSRSTHASVPLFRKAGDGQAEASLGCHEDGSQRAVAQTRKQRRQRRDDRQHRAGDHEEIEAAAEPAFELFLVLPVEQDLAGVG